MTNANVPSAEGLSRTDKAAFLPRTLLKSVGLRRSPQPFIQLWPSFGFAELGIWRSGEDRASSVIIHDPVPLRRQVGYGAVGRYIGRLSLYGRAPAIVSHSRDASDAIRELLPGGRIFDVAHPVRTTQVRHAEGTSPKVVVAGQFKPVRDLEMLRWLGPRLRRRGYIPQIIGRGWPADLEGWDIDSRFVSEAELDQVLGSAAAVVIPYKRYFQSGIMLRALEQGTLSISPNTSFARQVLGASSGCVLEDSEDGSAWLDAIDSVVGQPEQVADVFDRYKDLCDDSWRSLIADLPRPE